MTDDEVYCPCGGDCHHRANPCGISCVYGASRDAARQTELGALAKLVPVAERLLAADQTKLGVGVEVIVLEARRRRQGIVVQMGDEDDHPGCVLVWEGPDSEYPAWWSADYVVPRAQAVVPSAVGGTDG